MKVFRFMGKKEFYALSCGGDIIPFRNRHKSCTNSTGFCFISEEDFMPEQAFEFLSGIVSNYVCVEFECVDPSVFTETWGRYADPEGVWGECILVPELCIPVYNRDILVPVRYSVDFGRWHPRCNPNWLWYDFN